MPPDIDPSERERALRDADAELARLRRARPRRRRPFDVDRSWTDFIVTSVDGDFIPRLLFVAVVVISLLVGVCAA
ncbi:MAG: hypothetical protein M3282_08925 [Gemmatimonadota bacterium]|nr:hypothetical protein [Gemmatimonadota bacterium]